VKYYADIKVYLYSLEIQVYRGKIRADSFETEEYFWKVQVYFETVRVYRGKVRMYCYGVQVYRNKIRIHTYTYILLYPIDGNPSRKFPVFLFSCPYACMFQLFAYLCTPEHIKKNGIAIQNNLS
jgi:hypothetical protein